MSAKSWGSKLLSAAGDSRKVFSLALLIAGFCSLSHVFFLTDIYRDTAHVYAVFTRSIGEGNFAEGIATQVPMLNITLAGLLAYCGVEAVKALTLVAGIFYLATCFPLRKLLERYVSPLAAAWGCVLYVSAPKMIRFACAPLLDSARIFFLIAAILYFLRSSEEPKIKNAVLFGISAGFMAAARGEGIITTAALLGGYWLFLLIFRSNVQWKKQFIMLPTAMICTMAALAPFCAMNYSQSGYFTPDARMVSYIKRALAKPAPKKATAPAPEKPGEAKFVSYSKDLSDKKDLGHDLSCFVRGSYELYLALAALGLLLLIKRKQMSSDYWLFAGVSLIQFAVYMATVSAQRYYLFLIPLFMMFTLTGADFIRRQIIKYVPCKLHIFCAIGVAAILLGQIANGVKRAYSSKGKDFQAAGKWIAEYGKKHFPERKLIIFAPQMTETAYWSGALHTDGYEKKQNDPATFKDFDLAVVHRKHSFGMEKRTDLERIPNTPHSKNIWIFKVKKQENK
ncbi:MAG: glycosyltransferase family 39 protein [Lentisphaeria bacterium]|nr:glycosyltransferase family 39 protein [Lentisphaeria bacterium]